MFSVFNTSAQPVKLSSKYIELSLPDVQKKIHDYIGSTRTEANSVERFNASLTHYAERGFDPLQLVDQDGQSVLDYTLLCLYPLVLSDKPHSVVRYNKLLAIASNLLVKRAVFSLDQDIVTALYHAKDLYLEMFAHPRIFYIIATTIDRGAKAFCANLLTRAIQDRNHDFLIYAENKLSLDELQALLESYYTCFDKDNFALTNDLVIVADYKKIHTVISEITTPNDSIWQDSPSPYLFLGDVTNPSVTHNAFTLALANDDYATAHALLEPDYIQPCLHVLGINNPVPNATSTKLSPIYELLDHCLAVTDEDVSCFDLLTLSIGRGALLTAASMTKVLLLLSKSAVDSRLQQKIMAALFSRMISEGRQRSPHLLVSEVGVYALLLVLDKNTLQVHWPAGLGTDIQQACDTGVVVTWLDFACYTGNHDLFTQLLRYCDAKQLDLLFRQSNMTACLQFIVEKGMLAFAETLLGHKHRLRALQIDVNSLLDAKTIMPHKPQLALTRLIVAIRLCDSVSQMRRVSAMQYIKSLLLQLQSQAGGEAVTFAIHFCMQHFLSLLNHLVSGDSNLRRLIDSHTRHDQLNQLEQKNIDLYMANKNWNGLTRLIATVPTLNFTDAHINTICEARSALLIQGLLQYVLKKADIKLLSRVLERLPAFFLPIEVIDELKQQTVHTCLHAQLDDFAARSSVIDETGLMLVPLAPRV